MFIKLDCYNIKNDMHPKSFRLTFRVHIVFLIGMLFVTASIETVSANTFFR